MIICPHIKCILGGRHEYMYYSFVGITSCREWTDIYITHVKAFEVPKFVYMYACLHAKRCIHGYLITHTYLCIHAYMAKSVYMPTPYNQVTVYLGRHVYTL